MGKYNRYKLFTVIKPITVVVEAAAVVVVVVVCVSVLEWG